MFTRGRALCWKIGTIKVAFGEKGKGKKRGSALRGKKEKANEVRPVVREP